MLGAFKINSLSKFTVTAVGEVIRRKKSVQAFNNAQIDNSQFKFGGTSALFDGADDYLTVSTVASESSGAFTFEAWVRFSILPTSQTLGGGSYMMLATVGSATYFMIQNSSVQIAHSGSYYTINTATVTTGTWYHYAFVKSATGVWSVYLNGTKYTNNDTKNTAWLADGSLTIGRFIDSRGSWSGWIDEIRMSNTERYTANFTAPTEPFVNDANTLLLMHMNGTNASTFFDDDNGVRNQKGITAIGNAQISTAQSKFGGSSALFDGSGDWLTSSGPISLSTNDYTVECWVRTATVDRVIFDNRIGIQPAVFSVTNTGKIGYYDPTIGGAVGTTTITNSTWYHLAWVRSGSTFKMYVNGTAEYTNNSYSVDLGTNRPFRIGAEYTGNFNYNGHIDEFRVSNIARYTSNFTAPTEPFVNDANTLVLLHMDEVNGSTIFRDDNGGTYPLLGTQFNYGDLLRTTAITTNAMSSTSKTATISFWIKLNISSIVDYAQIWGMTTNNSVDNFVGLNVFFRSTNQIVFYGYKGVANGWVMQLSTPTNFLTVGEWTHIVLSYDRSVAGKFSCYKNGQAVTLTNTRFNNDIDGWNTATRVAVHANAYTGVDTGSDISLSQFWLDDTYIDLSTELTKFYNNGPLNLGADGTATGLSRPMIYHNGGPASFAVNNGRTTGTRVVYTLSTTGSPEPDYYSRINYVVPSAGFTDDGATKLLLKFDGNYNDTVGSGRTAKTIATLDSPSINTSIYKYGTASARIDASTTVLDRIYTTTTPADFQWNNQDFTLEFWTYVPSFTDMTYAYSSGLSKMTGSTAGSDWGWSFGFISDGTLRFYYWNGSGPSFVTSTKTASTNIWHHCMMDYRASDGRIRLGLNGEIVAVGTKTGTPSTGGTQFTIGSVRLNSPNFYIDEVRVSHTLRY